MKNLKLKIDSEESINQYVEYILSKNQSSFEPEKQLLYSVVSFLVHYCPREEHNLFCVAHLLDNIKLFPHIIKNMEEIDKKGTAVWKFHNFNYYCKINAISPEQIVQESIIPAINKYVGDDIISGKNTYMFEKHNIDNVIHKQKFDTAKELGTSIYSFINEMFEPDIITLDLFKNFVKKCEFKEERRNENIEWVSEYEDMINEKKNDPRYADAIEHYYTYTLLAGNDKSEIGYYNSPVGRLLLGIKKEEQQSFLELSVKQHVMNAEISEKVDKKISSLCLHTEGDSFC